MKLNDIVNIDEKITLKKLYSKQLNENINKHMLFENENFVVINKPSNLAVHGGTKINSNIIDILRNSDNYKDSFIELVHRIDKDTSGCLLLAKNKKFLTKMHDLLKKGKIIKEYHIIVSGKTKKKFKINLKQEILNNYNKKIKKTETITTTYCETIKNYDTFSFIKAFPKTGKMHQLRIHLAHIGNPIACDNKYGNVLLNKNFKLFGISRLFLHSASIKFKCPITNESFNIKAPYDNNMTMILNKIGIIKNAK
ncbi:MAG: RluA family pseudouridine synthase [Enterobacteriaceae bacterium]|nr:RluA family pseudouridine synthase [Enterobacteriaceae bacterium]